MPPPFRRYYYPKQPAAKVGAYCGLWTCGTELNTSNTKLGAADIEIRDFAYTPTPPTTQAPTMAPELISDEVKDENMFSTPSSAATLAPLFTTLAAWSVAVLLC
jgi:copper(I)-binding protein